jgi:HEAT repeat protein
MDYIEPEIYLLGIHHVQMEGSFGPPVDAAAKLRAYSALGLARTRHPQALEEIVHVLGDPWPQARIGAARALASNGGHAGALLLRLKILTGEDELDVLSECFSGLLASAPESSLPLIATYIDSEDQAIAEVALLAIGSSRLPEALTLLQKRWERPTLAPLRRALLLAIAMVRSEAAVEFLISLLPDSNVQTAKDIIAALAIFRDNDKVRRAVDQAISALNDNALSEAFRRAF